MKYVSLFFLVTSLLIYPASASDLSDLPQVRVQGKATKKVIPDEMRWRLQVQNKGMELSKVAEQHTQKVAELLAFLKKQKVETEKTKTSQMEFGENWNYRERQRVKEGYFARTSVTFSTSDFDSYKSTWLGLSKLGSVSVQGVNFHLADQEAEEQKLKTAAVLDAKKRAEELAAPLGAKIAEPLLIEDSSRGGYHPKALSYAEASFSSAPAQEPSTAAGQIKIESQVNVVFRLVSPSQ